MTYMCMNTEHEELVPDELETEFEEKSLLKDGLSLAEEDSYYDSDYDGSEEHCQYDHDHDDVSRTVSDTLGLEFFEYVSTSCLPTKSKSTIDSLSYQNKLEFALKLGYTEKLVQAALHKLGPNPEQNELLAELIKLGAQQQTSAKLKDDSDGYDNVDELNELIITSATSEGKLRPIVIDGSNVAMSHGNKEVFSCRGIKLCVDWFRFRGHTEITVFVPKWRKETPRPDNPVVDQEILKELERERLLVFTPSREVGGKRMACYDDRYILKLAADNDGIVVSNDNYRDLVQECPEFRKVVEERILMYSFVNDRFMPPDDPLGRSGPMLDNFLKTLPYKRGGELCLYGKKCTYGNKCKYNHPERGSGPQKSVTDRLVENAQRTKLARSQDANSAMNLRGKSLSLPLQPSLSDEQQTSFNTLPFNTRKQPLSRTRSTNVNHRKSDTDSPKCIPNCQHLASTPTSSSPTSYYQMFYPINHLSMNQATEVPTSSTNVHQKLQRQLSINPSCDPRIYQADKQHFIHQHMPASRHYSYPDPNYLNCHHSIVTRIASAPPANHRNTITNDCNHVNSMWSLPFASANSGFINIEECRRKLRYHLTSIFPEEQVDTAMRFYPNESNPQKICAAILSMFPPKS